MIISIDVHCKIKMKSKTRIGALGQPIKEQTKFGWVLIARGRCRQTNIFNSIQKINTTRCADSMYWVYMIEPIKAQFT